MHILQMECTICTTGVTGQCDILLTIHIPNDTFVFRVYDGCETLIRSALLHNCVPESAVFPRTRSLTKLVLLRFESLVLTMILYTKMARSSLRLNKS